ncbi:hypothetical protein I6F26_00325 [Ensifer sp. IC3342]|nr:hypothetical protein [Ensifer sp. BRP08]MCA1445041.1 hypothetical protein [Ensifer sp. IC3342]
MTGLNRSRSSVNLALGGEEANGDNLLIIRDPDVVTVFAIEAIGLIDHFNFLNGLERAPAAKDQAAAIADRREAAVQSE